MTELDAYTTGLTVDQEKNRFYQQDIYYRETVRQLAGWAEPDDVRRLLLTRSYLLFKPEALIARKVGTTLAYLAERGIEANFVASVTVNRSMLRALWWYQLNAAPLAIVRACDILINDWELLFIGFVDSKADGNSPPEESAARRLSDLKGSSRDIGKGLGLLRDELGCTTTCLNFIHAPDEPADVLREIGVMFERPVRDQVLAALGGPVDAVAVERAVAAAYTRYKEVAIDLEPCLENLRKGAGPREAPYLAGIERALVSSEDEYSDDERLALIEWLCQTDIVSRWDRAVVAAHVTGVERADVMPMIGPPPGIRSQYRREEVAQKQARLALRLGDCGDVGVQG